jgi:hypothetical protein
MRVLLSCITDVFPVRIYKKIGGIAD